MRQFVLALFAILYLSQSGAANAHSHHHQHSVHRVHSGFHDGRPSAWCGWYMRQQVGKDPGSSFNLARNWSHYGSAAAGPNPGVIVVWPHHVGKITGYDNARKQWIVLSGNDSHRVRERPRGLAGVIAYRSP